MLVKLTTLLTIIKVFIKYKILSAETFLSAYMHINTHTHTHTGTCAHEHTYHTKLNLHTTWAANKRLETDEDYSNERKTWQVYIVLGKEMF